MTHWQPLPIPENATLRPGDCRGKLTILESAGLRDGRVYWLCRCACGNLAVGAEFRILAGKVKSCGCGEWKRSKEFRDRLAEGERMLAAGASIKATSAATGVSREVLRRRRNELGLPVAGRKRN